jgi:DNA-binding SARP family transcriptional activator
MQKVIPHTLTVSLLGPPRIQRNGATVVIRRRKVLALLAYLAVREGEHGRDALAELLYPRLDRLRAAAGLRYSLSLLRSAWGVAS